MTPARCHLGLGTVHLVLAARQRDDSRRTLLVVLALRHLGEAAWLRTPTPRRRRVARWVDTTHALTAVGWGLSSPERRRDGVVSVALSLVALRAES